ncbi:hypothetical protein GCM10027277_26780 [Pseudoduganella ginsengisoli]|uniref:Uncharacterized protein n=1 Tax=Pseudoduganella ginsengisoli TaxID=1462440 RepID=A0A6L6Q1K1_9BURK|nr:hypothetical protein [Pseudoduganella ginsengisoli]MTW03515.1 hypothetical protein [Pseudoduganella ginsengisoli]
MRLFKCFLLIAVFVLHSVAGAAASVHTCCGGGMDDCTVAQCAAMGCLAQQPPLLTAPPLPVLPVVKQPAPQGMIDTPSPAPVQEIWCPPD